MNDDDSAKELGTATIAMQTVVVALSLGIVLFAGYLCAQQGLDLSDLGIKGVFSWMTLAMGAFGLILSRVVPRFLPDEGSLQPGVVVKSGEAGLRQRLLSGIMTRLVIGAAICEGFAFANLAAFMIEQSVPCLGMALLLLLGVLLLFPTKSSVAAALEDSERAARERAQWK
jgi:hypothetical protein